MSVPFTAPTEGACATRNRLAGSRRRRSTCRVDQQEQFEDGIGRRGRGLQNEEIPPTDVLVDANEYFAVRETANRSPAEGDSQSLCDFVREQGVGGARKNHERSDGAAREWVRHGIGVASNAKMDSRKT